MVFEAVMYVGQYEHLDLCRHVQNRPLKCASGNAPITTKDFDQLHKLASAIFWIFVPLRVTLHSGCGEPQLDLLSSDCLDSAWTVSISQNRREAEALSESTLR